MQVLLATLKTGKDFSALVFNDEKTALEYLWEMFDQDESPVPEGFTLQQLNDSFDGQTVVTFEFTEVHGHAA